MPVSLIHLYFPFSFRFFKFLHNVLLENVVAFDSSARETEHCMSFVLLSSMDVRMTFSVGLRELFVKTLLMFPVSFTAVPLLSKVILRMRKSFSAVLSKYITVLLHRHLR